MLPLKYKRKIYKGVWVGYGMVKSKKNELHKTTTRD